MRLTLQFYSHLTFFKQTWESPVQDFNTFLTVFPGKTTCGGGPNDIGIFSKSCILIYERSVSLHSVSIVL